MPGRPSTSSGGSSTFYSEASMAELESRLPPILQKSCVATSVTPTAVLAVLAKLLVG